MPQSFFATKHRQNWIDANLERELYPYMITVMKNLESPVLQIGGIENHVHILTVLSKNYALAEVLKNLKESSSKFAKTRGVSYSEFTWQIGYGAFSIGESGVPELIQYIRNQKKHHSKCTFETEYVAILKNYNIRYD